MKPLKRICLGVIGVVAVLYAAACLYLWATQVEKVLMPVGEYPTTPEDLEMEFSRVEIPVGVGEERRALDGFWVPSGNEGAAIFLYLHGQEASIGKNLEHTERFHELGYDVLVFDYRGFGRSFGNAPELSEATIYEDAEAAWNYVVGERGVSPRDVIIFGHSLGGAVAIELALRHPEAAGLITEATFTSIVDMSRLQYGGSLRLLPMDLILHQHFDSIDKIGGLELPILLIHGKADTRVPHRMSEELYAEAPEPKQLLLIESGEHADSGEEGGDDYAETIRAFVERCLNPSPVDAVR